MSIEIIIPALGESISEATIAKWYKKQGDLVTIDDLLLELETEKVTLEVNATESGVLGQILKSDGETVSVGEIVGHIVKDTSQVKAAPIVKASSNIDDEQQNSTNKLDHTNTMSPSAKKWIEENNINPENISGSGKDRRITKSDVLSVLSADIVNPSNTDTIQSKNETKSVERIRMSRLRQTIAQRLKDSQNTAAILTTFNEIDMSNVIAMRKMYREEFEKKHGVKLGFMSFFVKASIDALKAVPSVNAEIDGDDLVYKYYYDIGVAVGTPQGLVVPVVRNSDTLTFAGIEKEILHLSTKAREGKLSMSDLSGGTFSISNGGVYGSLFSAPIINPPQSGIVGLHKTEERPVAVNGKVEIRPMMYVALSYDHRIIDGKDAVTFLVKVKSAIENPEKLLLNI